MKRKTCELRRAAQAGNRWRRRIWSKLNPDEKRAQLDAATKMIQTQVKD